MKRLYKDLILFILFGCFYVTIEVLYRGYSHWLMMIVAGVASVIIDKLNDYISWDIPLPLQALIGTVVILILELASGTLALTFLNIRIWDYSNLPLNCFNGFLCPQFALVWYFMAYLIIVLADAINYYWLCNEERPYYIFWNKNKKLFLPEKIK